jgi:hypothetical protein
MGFGRYLMRLLFRVVAALLLAVPLLVVLVIIFATTGKRRASLPLEGEFSHSMEGGAAVGLSPRASEGGSRAIPSVLRNAIPGGYYPPGAGAPRFL